MLKLTFATTLENISLLFSNSDLNQKIMFTLTMKNTFFFFFFPFEH